MQIFPDLVAAVIPTHARGKPIELWWQDEGRVGQQGTLTRVWAERGSRPRAPRDQRYDWAYLFGAVCPARDVGAALVLPVADGEAMNLHLAEISRNVTTGSHAVVLLDGAGWHQTGGKLNVPDNISLLKLPAYSPELNPTENVWEYLRQNQLSNRIFESYDAIVDACWMLGTHSQPNQAEFDQSLLARGHRSMSNAVGIRLSKGMISDCATCV